MLDDDDDNTRTIVDGATVYNDALYVAVMNGDTGVEVWRTDGTNWTHVTDGNEGFGHSTTFAAELIPFNGYLYAWTSDYARGQEVRRTKCPLCQSKTISGAGLYNFAEVGTTINFTSESLDSVEVCVYPDAFPTGQTSNRPVKRHYGITPSAGTFNADLTLSYTQAEFDASDISNEDTTCLTRWTGSTWSECSATESYPSQNEVKLDEVTAFSTWAIGGQDNEPTAVTLRYVDVRPSPADPLLWLLAAGTLLPGLWGLWKRARKI